MSSLYVFFALVLSLSQLSHASFPHFGYYGDYPTFGYYGLTDPYPYATFAYGAYPYGYPYAMGKSMLVDELAQRVHLSEDGHLSDTSMISPFAKTLKRN
ncbi:hypothetical protein Y032_0042g595 [Ancylostoma ceylanicum]|nr:hypothetical protein Y032_0042g595 [Ancylostoma ceylanicum]